VELSDGKRGRVAATCIVAREVDAPAGVKPLEGRLLTHREASTFEAAAELIDGYRARWEREMCQTQPIKMTWCPLRHVFRALPCLRGKLKREHVVDVNLVAGHHDFTDQAPGHGLTVLKRELLQILAQPLAKGLGRVHDLLPMKRLLLTAG
jgi:hypothetical protein